MIVNSDKSLPANFRRHLLLFWCWIKVLELFDGELWTWEEDCRYTIYSVSWRACWSYRGSGRVLLRPRLRGWRFRIDGELLSDSFAVWAVWPPCRVVRPWSEDLTLPLGCKPGQACSLPTVSQISGSKRMYLHKGPIICYAKTLWMVISFSLSQVTYVAIFERWKMNSEAQIDRHSVNMCCRRSSPRGVRVTGLSTRQSTRTYSI